MHEGDRDDADLGSAVLRTEREIIGAVAATVAGILVKLRVLADLLRPDSLEGEVIVSALADAERLAPEKWPNDYPPIPAA